MGYVLKAKKPNDPLELGDGSLTPNERKVIRQYLDALRKLNIEVNNPDVIRRIMNEVIAGNPLSAANQVPWASFTSSLEDSVTALAAQVAISANLNLTKLPSRVQYEAKFDLTDPRAIGWAQVRSGSTIRQVNEYSRQAVSKIIQDGLRSNLDPDQVRESIKRVVGLDSRQATALENFYNKTVEDGTLKGLSFKAAVDRAEKLGTKYRDRLWGQRAERIARTELAEAANQGRFLSWMEADQQGLIAPNSKKRWLTAADERTCEICSALNGQIVGWEEQFSIGKLMPTAHPNCRCTALLIPAEPSAVVQQPTPATGEYEGYNLKQPRNTTSSNRGQSDVAANNLRDSARVVEPKITKDMIDLSKVHKGKMVGLENRLKTQSSLSRKIEERARKTNVPVAAKEIHDGVRYTMTSKRGEYVDTVNNVVGDLRSKGYQVTTRNNWVAGNPYLGVNAQVVSPTGVKFELQFHTPESLRLKNQTHPIYEKMRVSSDPVVRSRAHKDMVDLADGVKFPTGDVRLLGDPLPAEMDKSRKLVLSKAEAK